MKRRHSVFPLFIDSICRVIVIFCRCLCTFSWLLCRRRYLRCAKRCSLCFARGVLLSSSSPLAMNFSRRSPKEFRLKIEDFQPIVVLVFLCHKHMSLSRIIHENALLISGKVYVAWKRKMLHDVSYMTSLTERSVYLNLFMAH